MMEEAPTGQIRKAIEVVDGGGNIAADTVHVEASKGVGGVIGTDGLPVQAEVGGPSR